MAKAAAVPSMTGCWAGPWVAGAPGGKHVALLNEAGEAAIGDARTGAILRRFDARVGTGRDIAVDRTGEIVLVAGDRGARLFTGTGERLLTGQRTHGVVLTADGAHASLEPKWGRAWVYDTRTGNQLHRLALGSAPQSSMGSEFISPSGGVIDAATGERVLAVYHAGQTAAALSPDGRWLATSDSRGMTDLWDRSVGGKSVRQVHTVRLHRDLTGHFGTDLIFPSPGVAFGPGGAWFAVAGGGSAPAGLASTNGGYTKIHYGKLLAAEPCLDHAVSIIDTGTGALLGLLRAGGLEDAAHVVEDLRASSDGRRLLARSRDGSIRLWSS